MVVVETTIVAQKVKSTPERELIKSKISGIWV
jgi:hypothetical protein